MERDASHLEHEAQLDEIRSQLEFANTKAMTALRQNTWDAASEAAEKALAETEFEPMELARKRAEAMVEVIERDEAEAYEKYLSAHISRDDNPELYDKLLILLKSTAVANVSDEEWTRGQRDEHGDYIDGTSGRLQAADIFDSICEEILATSTPETPDTDPTHEEEQKRYDESIVELAAARGALAQISVERRRLIRSGGKKALELEDRYNQAEAAYERAYLKNGKANIDLLRAQGKTDEQVSAKVTADVVLERKAFTEAEAVILEGDDSKFGKVAKWLVKRHNFIFANAFSGAALGFGAKKAVKGTVGFIAAPALPIALGVGAAVKTTKAVLNATVGNRVNQHKMHGKRSEEDIASFNHQASEWLNDGNEKSDEDLANESYALLYNSIDDRIENDRRSNRNRVIAAGLVAGGAAVAGALAADALNGGLFDRHSVPSSFGNGDSLTTTTGTTTPEATTGIQYGPDTSIDTAGFNADVNVEGGHGFTYELQDLADQKGISLSGAESYDLYEFLEGKYGGNLLQGEGSSYLMKNGDYGIANSGSATWRPEVLHDIDHWLRIHNKAA